MTEDSLAEILRETYDVAPERDKALHVMLFAIQYANELESHAAARICEIADIPKWGPQINLGKKLAAHVQMKP